MSGGVAATGRRGGEGAKDATTSGGPGGGVTDHGDLTGLTDNDHPQYALAATVTALDARVEDLEEAPGGGVTDHGALSGLTDDDHPQYGPKDLAAYLRSSAAAKLGVPADQLIFDVHHLAVRGVTGINAVVSGAGAGPIFVDGALQLKKGSTAGGLYVVEFAVNAGSIKPKLLLTDPAAKWWVASLFRIDTAVAASVMLGMASYGTAGVLEWWMGVNGAYSLTNFVLAGRTGGAIDSGVPIDTNYHLHQGWRDGSTANYQIDAGAVVQSNVRPTTDASAGLIAYDSALATERTVSVVLMAVARVRP